MQFVMGHGHPVFRARPGKPHNVLRADIRGEDGCADHPPTEIAAREEVVSSGVLGPADDPPGNAQQDAEVKGNGEPVEVGQSGSAGYGQGRLGRHGAARGYLVEWLHGYISLGHSWHWLRACGGSVCRATRPARV